MLKWAVYAAALILSLVIIVSRSWGHPNDMMKCIPELKGKQVSLVSQAVHPSGLWAERYDIDGDKRPDVVTLTPITGYVYNWNREDKPDLGVHHGEHPVMYQIDLNKNGRADVVYVDKGGEGKCEDIQVYEVLEGAKETGAPPAMEHDDESCHQDEPSSDDKDV